MKPVKKTQAKKEAQKRATATIRIWKDTHKKLKVAASERDISIQDFVEDLARKL